VLAQPTAKKPAIKLTAKTMTMDMNDFMPAIYQTRLKMKPWNARLPKFLDRLSVAICFPVLICPAISSLDRCGEGS